MTETMTYQDTIQRVGYTIIDGVKVVQHVCTISTDDPTKMRVTMTKLDGDLYEQNRETCRADFAVFEDAAYTLRDELVTKASN